MNQLYEAAKRVGPIVARDPLLVDGHALKLLSASCVETQRTATSVLFDGEKPVLKRAVKTAKNAPFLKKLLALVPRQCSREDFEGLALPGESPFEWLIKAFSDENMAAAERAAIAGLVLDVVDTLVGDKVDDKAEKCRAKALSLAPGAASGQKRPRSPPPLAGPSQSGGSGNDDDARHTPAHPDKAELLNKRNAEQQSARRGSGGGGEPTIAAPANDSPATGPVAATAPSDPYTFLGAAFPAARREAILVHGEKGGYMLDAMQVIVKLLKGMLDANEAAKLHDPDLDLYNHRYLSLKEPRLNDFFFDDVLNKDCGSLSVGKRLDGKGASRHFEAVCAAGYDVIHFREVHATEGTRAKAGPKSAADLVTLLLRVEGGGSGKLLKSGAGIDELRRFLDEHREWVEMAFLTELKHNSKTQPQLVEYSYANGELKELQLPIKGLLGVTVDPPPKKAARMNKGLDPDYGFFNVG